MKTQKTNLSIAGLIGLTVLSLTLLGAPAANAQTKVRVQAKVQTPVGVIHVSNTPSVRYRELPPRPVLPSPRYVVKITAQDRQIARRLARYTGAEKQRLLNLKREGYTWVQIGQWLDLSPRAVRAAHSQVAWNRFLDDQHVVIRCGNDYDDDRGRGRGHDRH